MTSSDFKLAPRKDHTMVMREAIALLESALIPFTQPNPHQLKIGAFNFYPTTGKITRDGEPAAWSDRGLAALIAHLKRPAANIHEYAEVSSNGSNVLILRPPRSP